MNEIPQIYAVQCDRKKFTAFTILLAFTLYHIHCHLIVHIASYSPDKMPTVEDRLENEEQEEMYEDGIPHLENEERDEDSKHPLLDKVNNVEGDKTLLEMINRNHEEFVHLYEKVGISCLILCLFHIFLKPLLVSYDVALIDSFKTVC